MTAVDVADLSSNRSCGPLVSLTDCSAPLRHPELCFDDGNIAILAENTYFLVHRDPLGRHSPVLKKLINDLPTNSACFIEGVPVITVPYTCEAMSHLIRTLYGYVLRLRLVSFSDRRISFPVAMVGEDFAVTSALLKLATAYEIESLRTEIIRRLSQSWPAKLDQWEIREKSAVNEEGVYAPCPKLPHPMYVCLPQSRNFFGPLSFMSPFLSSLVISVAREVDAPELLPSAFYDLSRYLPSQVCSGYKDPLTLVPHRLSSDDLFRVFRGKEQTARYFSTFIVNELEGRMPCKFCLNRNELVPFRKRSCQVAFETITVSILRDSNGMLLNHNTDPLFAIADSLAMQTKEDAPGSENTATYRACEACRLEYMAVVKAVREEFWRRLPEWFDLTVSNWA